MGEPQKDVEKEPEIVVKGLLLDESQKEAYVAAQHQALVGHAQDAIFAALELARSRGLHPNDFAVVVFDVEDPHAPAEIVEQMRGMNVGYGTRVFSRQELSAFLLAYEEPAAEADVKWSTKARVYVRDRRVVTDYPKYQPYLKEAKKVLAPQTDDSYMICTFTYGGMRVIDALIRMENVEQDAPGQSAPEAPADPQ